MARRYASVNDFLPDVIMASDNRISDSDQIGLGRVSIRFVAPTVGVVDTRSEISGSDATLSRHLELLASDEGLRLWIVSGNRRAR